MAKKNENIAEETVKRQPKGKDRRRSSRKTEEEIVAEIVMKFDENVRDCFRLPKEEKCT